MTPDKETEALLNALRQALAESNEQPLYRSGKSDGLFATRTGPNASAAERALRTGLLELVRTEDKGKQSIEWVRLTPAGVGFLHSHESPRAVLEDLLAALQANRAGLPDWLESIRRDIHRVVERLDALSLRVEEALKRVDAPAAAISNGLANAAPWAAEAISYLDKRAASGPAGDCPMPELFAAIRQIRPDLSLTEFHDGVRRLADYKAIALRPFAGPVERLDQPEYALLDGATMLYYVSR